VHYLVNIFLRILTQHVIQDFLRLRALTYLEKKITLLEGTFRDFGLENTKSEMQKIHERSAVLKIIAGVTKCNVNGVCIHWNRPDL
jgi:hypothetical protein